ncbi:hypothetical protein EYC84_001904 [Monilinia fructicola]|uniref:Uncharacterized protein n=1 Tax=Monilinia fructicola TaxID=38448 RepID=A0A5M9JVZ3_MONFR|nr:hypothetical protein EYC84_001904 [Monilinia fructicola]
MVILISKPRDGGLGQLGSVNCNSHFYKGVLIMYQERAERKETFKFPEEMALITYLSRIEIPIDTFTSLVRTWIPRLFARVIFNKIHPMRSATEPLQSLIFASLQP